MQLYNFISNRTDFEVKTILKYIKFNESNNQMYNNN